MTNNNQIYLNKTYAIGRTMAEYENESNYNINFIGRGRHPKNNDIQIYACVNRTTKKSSLFGIDTSEKGMINCNLEHVMHVIDNAVNEVI